MTRRRIALEFLVLLTLASLAIAINGCSLRREPAPQGVASADVGAAEAQAAADAQAGAEDTVASVRGHEFGRVDDDGRYTAPDGSFTVGPPHAPRSYEFQNMRYTDGTRAAGGVDLRYVVFGPGPSDPTAYHVVVAKGHGTQSWAAADAGEAARARAISDAYMRRYDARHGGTSKLVAFQDAVVAGHRGGYVVYRHDAVGPDAVAFYVVFLITDHGGDRLVNVMAEKLTPANPWYPGKETLMAGTWTRFNRFAASVVVAGE